MANEKYVINSILRAAQVLEAFDFEKNSYRFSELERKLGFNKSSMKRVLASLEQAGFLQRDPNSKEYSLTHRLFKIGSVYRYSLDLYKVAVPFLWDLCKEMKETVHLGTLNDYQVFYVTKIEAPQSISLTSRIGATVPSYATAIGKALLAFQSDEWIEQFLKTVRLERHTPNTICDPDELRFHLKRIREQGFAIGHGERQEDTISAGAPIFGADGKVIAGVGVAGPAFRISRERIIEEIAPAVKETTRQISIRMGYQGEGNNVE